MTNLVVFGVSIAAVARLVVFGLPIAIWVRFLSQVATVAAGWYLLATFGYALLLLAWAQALTVVLLRRRPTT